MASEPLILTPQRQRPGRRFAPVAELALEADTLRAARSLPHAHSGLIVLRETAGPFGVPDLLALVGTPSLLRDRLALPVPPLLNEVDAGVVSAAAPRAPRSISTLARRVGWDEESARRRLPELLKAGALIQVGRDAFVRPPALRPVGRLYAVEAKVKDWRRALRQARAYSVWCDSYVIVMGSVSAVSSAAFVEAVRNDRGGLMVDGRWMLRPRIGKKTPSQRLWGSEHLVAAAEGLSV